MADFSAITRAWFFDTLGKPTPAQAEAWESISSGQHTLVVAPTGSGKTLAAFLWALDRLATRRQPPPEAACTVLYVSPLKALAVDVERNLRLPLAGIQDAARARGEQPPEVRIAVRTGDTPTAERRAFARTPSDILITTPESLYLLLTSKARSTLAAVETVIVDEVHALCGSKRGAHLALSLERLDALLPKPAQRIGLSATVRPISETAGFLGGAAPVRVVQPPAAKTLDLRVEVPVEDMTIPDPQTRSLWPAVEEQVHALIKAHRSTIVFVNSRRGAERLCARLNEIDAELPELIDLPAQIMAQSGVSHGAEALLARAHHGSMSKEERSHVEAELKAGRLAAVVATSSLELGIDMGAVDLVIQVEAPPTVAAGLQRIGRAGHHVGAVSKGVILPKHRGDLLACAVVAERMIAGGIEELSYPHNPLDVLAQQIVAMVAMDDWSVPELATLIRRSAPFARLPDSALSAVLDMLAGHYPSTAFADLRPKVLWDRATGLLTARPGIQRLAILSGGTIPDRGLFGVFVQGDSAGKRVGELDEEMVYESRVGDVFTLGSTSWRIDELTPDRVLVSPAPGAAARLPFWKGDSPGRPSELGRAVGVFIRSFDGSSLLDDRANANLSAYLDEQRSATGHLPHDRKIVVERFRDELGDWRIVIHSVFGARVNAAWGLAIGARMKEKFGVDAQLSPADDGIVLRLPDMLDNVPGAELVVFPAAEITTLVEESIGGSALFAGRFRECSARALLLPRRDPRRRQPLWQQRQRSAQLLDVAREFPAFPITLEAARECLRDVLDLPELAALMRDIAARRVAVVEVETSKPSPFARSLLVDYVGAFLYGDDVPLAERRAAALALDSTLLAELLGRADLRELLDGDILIEAGVRLRARQPGEELTDLLRRLGDLPRSTIAGVVGDAAGGTDPSGAADRGKSDVDAEFADLAAAGRILEIPIAGERRWIGVEDCARYRDGLGVVLPAGIPEQLLEPAADPLGDLVSRYARTHPPFSTQTCAAWFGLGVDLVESTLRRLADTGRVTAGEFTPGGTHSEWCDTELLRLLRRRSLAALRREIEPTPPKALASFLPRWQGVGSDDHGLDALVAALGQLQGCPLSAPALERLILPARVYDYRPAMLDELCSAGELLWAGCGSEQVVLCFPELAELLLPPVGPLALTTEHEAILAALDSRALFFTQFGDPGLLEPLWELVWAGYISNDTMAPLRASLAATSHSHPTVTRARRIGRFSRPLSAGPPSAAGRWFRLPERDLDPTRRAAATAELLLERHGVLTRGAVTAEGGFSAVYPVLRALEERGTARRGYFVEGLGAAQFALPGAVDQLRVAAATGSRGVSTVLTATDPANPFGAALPWPSSRAGGPDEGDEPGQPAGHRPGRRAGAAVVITGGELVLYVERGGRTILHYSDDDDVLDSAVKALVDAVHAGALGPLSAEGAAGPLERALMSAGFRETPRGLRLHR